MPGGPSGTRPRNFWWAWHSDPALECQGSHPALDQGVFGRPGTRIRHLSARGAVQHSTKKYLVGRSLEPRAGAGAGARSLETGPELGARDRARAAIFGQPGAWSPEPEPEPEPRAWSWSRSRSLGPETEPEPKPGAGEGARGAILGQPRAWSPDPEPEFDLGVAAGAWGPIFGPPRARSPDRARARHTEPRAGTEAGAQSLEPELRGHFLASQEHGAQSWS